MNTIHHFLLLYDSYQDQIIKKSPNTPPLSHSNQLFSHLSITLHHHSNQLQCNFHHTYSTILYAHHHDDHYSYSMPSHPLIYCPNKLIIYPHNKIPTIPNYNYWKLYPLPQTNVLAELFFLINIKLLPLIQFDIVISANIT